MTDRLSPAEHTVIGAIAGSMEVLLMQPTIAIKNALQEGRPVPWSPSALYRGLVVGHTLLRPLCNAYIMHSMRQFYSLLQVNVGSIAPITAIQVGQDIEVALQAQHSKHCAACCAANKEKAGDLFLDSCSSFGLHDDIQRLSLLSSLASTEHWRLPRVAVSPSLAR